MLIYLRRGQRTKIILIKRNKEACVFYSIKEDINFNSNEKEMFRSFFIGCMKAVYARHSWVADHIVK